MLLKIIRDTTSFDRMQDRVLDADELAAKYEVKEISKKWTMPVKDWGLAYSQFMIFFEDRFAA